MKRTLSSKVKRLLCLSVALLILPLFYLLPHTASFSQRNPALSASFSQVWATDQIQRDLVFFSEEGIKRSEIYETMRNTPPKEGFLHVKIQKGKVSFSSDQYLQGFGTRSKCVKKFFTTLSKRYQLPDVEFIVCLHDAYDVKELPKVPIFVFAKNDSSTRNVLIPDFEALRPSKQLAQYKKAVEEHPWSGKKNVVFWRGATTGGIYELDNYLNFPRVKLVFLSQEHPEWLDAAFTLLCQSSPVVLNKILELSRPLLPHVEVPDHFAYKYLIDIDGNSCTYARCRWILLSNSTLLKPFSHNIQWYYGALQPYVHYLPLKEDLSDLPQVYEWLVSHDEEAKKIADEGRNLGLSVFNPEAIQDYCAALLYEYSKLLK